MKFFASSFKEEFIGMVSGAHGVWFMKKMTLELDVKQLIGL